MNARAIADCLEANAYYNGEAYKIHAFSQGVRASTSNERMHNVIAEAFLNRAETLTNGNTQK